MRGALRGQSRRSNAGIIPPNRSVRRSRVSVAIIDNVSGTATVKTIELHREASALLDLKKNYAWYAFTVFWKPSNAEFRYAGRVETGKPGVSDPLMGGVV